MVSSGIILGANLTPRLDLNGRLAWKALNSRNAVMCGQAVRNFACGDTNAHMKYACYFTPYFEIS